MLDALFFCYNVEQWVNDFVAALAQANIMTTNHAMITMDTDFKIQL
jgi:hypothetical protein